MRLSEAMRLGAMFYPQTVGAYREGVAVCAIGGVAAAIGIPVPDEDDDLALDLPKLIGHFPILDEYIILTPYLIAKAQIDRVEEYSGKITLHDYIAELNDTGYFSREQIADWIVTSGYDQEDQTLVAQEQPQECIHA